MHLYIAIAASCLLFQPFNPAPHSAIRSPRHAIRCSTDDDLADILKELGDDDDDDFDFSAIDEESPSSPPVDLSPPNDLPPGSTIAVAGCTTAAGKALLRSLFFADKGWKLRALVPSGGSLGAEATLGIEEASSASLKASLDGASALVLVSTAAGGKGGVENEEVPKYMAALPDSLRRVVYLSTHGVERTSELPFSLQNAWGGPLDKLRATEQEVTLRAMNRLPSFSIVRVGKLVESSSSAGDAAGRCALAPGDDLQGDLPVATASAVLLQTLARSESVNASFSAAPLGGANDLSVPPDAPDEAHWSDEFQKLIGPEIYRRALSPSAASSMGDAELIRWVRTWALMFVQPGSGLTTPVELEELESGVTLRFVQKNPNARYAAFDQEETDDEKWAKAKASTKASKAMPDGALRVNVETEPYPRVRVARAEMGGEGIVVKEMSEGVILAALDKAVAGLK